MSKFTDLYRRAQRINREYPAASTLSNSNADKYIDVVSKIPPGVKRENAATILLDLDLTFHTLCIVPPNYASLKSTDLDFILSNIKKYNEKYDEFIRFTTNNPDLPQDVKDFAKIMQEKKEEHQKWLASYLVEILKTVAQDSKLQLAIILKEDPFSGRFDKEQSLKQISDNIRKMLNIYDKEFATIINNNPVNKEIIAAYQSLVEVSDKISDIQLANKLDEADRDYEEDKNNYERLAGNLNLEKIYKNTLPTIERLKASINRSLDDLKQLLENTKRSYKVTASSDNHDQHHQLIKKLEELIAKVSAIANGYDTLAKSIPRDNQQSPPRAARSSNGTPFSSPHRRDQVGTPYSSPSSLRRNQDESPTRRPTADKAISVLERSQKASKGEAAETQNRSNKTNPHNPHS